MDCGGTINCRNSERKRHFFCKHMFCFSVRCNSIPHKKKLLVSYEATLLLCVSLPTFYIPAAKGLMWKEATFFTYIRSLWWYLFHVFFFLLFLQWSMIRNSCQCGGITESSDLTYRGSQRERRLLLLSFVFIKTSSMNVTIMRPSASASTRCWRNTLIGKYG